MLEHISADDQVEGPVEFWDCCIDGCAYRGQSLGAAREALASLTSTPTISPAPCRQYHRVRSLASHIDGARMAPNQVGSIVGVVVRRLGR
jgi:hypothetical protein